MLGQWHARGGPAFGMNQERALENSTKRLEEKPRQILDLKNIIVA
jgi:hypothetical protein